MALTMVRVDDRLIHGQVVVGWCPFIKPDKLVLCDDEIAKDEWEAEIYKDAAGEYQTCICSVEAAAELLKQAENSKERLFLLVASPHVLVQLLQLGVNFDKVVVGGMHYQSGKRKITNYVYIDDEDLKDFQFLASHKVRIEAKDLPHCKSIDLAKQLGIN